MKRFEYLTGSFHKREIDKSPEQSDLAGQFDYWLNQFGVQGWEAISIRPTEQSIGVTFKREKQD